MPDKKINLLIAVHCHQPIGNFDWVFKEAYDKAYLPFINTLEKHPKIKTALHYSGSLLDWLKDKRPEFLETLKRLVKKGQVEMMSGGYYEPILPLIPDRDKLGQIKMESDFLRKYTRYEPKGAWLAERVWEPYLAKIFNQAGLKYTILDDSHFEFAGKKAEEVLGYYLTEEEGFDMALFPSSKILRYSMPFKLPRETIDYLRSVATKDGERAVTFGDDGEKFGLWPKTYKWVYEEGWLENFFKTLEDNADWINIIHPSEYLERYEPLGRLYIPCASYPEMLEWSGGYFRNFLAKYPEANWMHKRMLYTSERLHSAGSRVSKIKEAKESLYRAQCNCAYWHGVFGGLYLHHLRNGVYANLINAEKLIADSAKSKAPIKTDIFDIDKDGSDEIILENGPLSAYICPREGGTIAELDYRPKAVNLINTLARRAESYHKKLDKAGLIKEGQPAGGVASIHDLREAKDKGLDELLNYDWHRKSCLVDHFLAPDSDVKGFSRASFNERGDFVSAPYKFNLKNKGKKIIVQLEREGAISIGETASVLKLDKSIVFEPQRAGLDIDYRLRNTLDQELNLWFGTEFNFSVRDHEFSSAGELMNIKGLEAQDEWSGLRLDFSLSKDAALWFYPIETVSESEAGLEKTYQGLCLLFNWRFVVKPKQAWSVNLSLDVR